MNQLEWNDSLLERLTAGEFEFVYFVIAVDYRIIGHE